MNFGAGTTVYQGDNRYSLKDILFLQNRLELREETGKWFLRAYSTHEDAGKTAMMPILQHCECKTVLFLINFIVINTEQCGTFSIGHRLERYRIFLLTL